MSKCHIVGNHMPQIFVLQEKREKKEKKKYITVDPNLLLSFIYFDQNHTGYLLDKDAEEILHAIGLSQSRAQVCYLTVQPGSAVGNVSGNRCESDCRSRGREFDPGLVPYFCGD